MPDPYTLPLYILNQVDELGETFGGQIPKEQQPAAFSVAGTFSIVANILPSVIARFERSLAGVEVNCYTGTSQQVQQMIRGGGGGKLA